MTQSGSMPAGMARAAALVRSSVIDLSVTERVCGPLPFDVAEGVRVTAEWLREIWDGELRT